MDVGTSRAAGVTVASLLRDDLFRDALVAGAARTERPVAWCLPFSDTAPQDLADAAVYVPRDALVGGRSAVIRRLAGSGATSVIVPVTPGQAFRELPEAVATAEAVGVPLLAVGPHVSFRRSSELIATLVLAQATHDLEYRSRVHRLLGDIFVRGAGLSALAHAMARASGTTVLVVGNHCEVLAEASPSSSSERLRKEMIEEVVDAVALPVEDDQGDSTVETTTVDVDGAVVQVVHAPVRAAGERFGFLLLVEPERPCSEHELSQRRILVEQGVTLTGSELLRMQSVREAQERTRNDFAHTLLHARFTDELELTTRAEHYGLPVDGRFVVYVVTTGAGTPEDEAPHRLGWEVERAAQAIIAPGLFTLTATVGSMIVVVCQLRKRRGHDRDAGQVTDELTSFGDRLRRSLDAHLGWQVRVSYGRPFNGATGIAKSYREARIAEGLARRVQTAPICSYAELRVFAAIEECAMTTSGQDFAAEVLEPLRKLDGHSGRLEELVLAFIEDGGNLSATARRLHLHRNTVLYKLERASRALQMDVRTTEAQFMIWLAHNIVALNDVVTTLDRELAPPR